MARVLGPQPQGPRPVVPDDLQSLLLLQAHRVTPVHGLDHQQAVMAGLEHTETDVDPSTLNLQNPELFSNFVKHFPFENFVEKIVENHLFKKCSFSQR